MNCVKCGREIGEDQVFCEKCLNEMESYPVKPGTAIHIPARDHQTEPKRNQQKKKLIRTPAEQIQRLRRRVLRLRIVLVLLLLLCGGLCFIIGRTVEELDFQRLLGQNYHTTATETSTEPLLETIVP